MLPAIRIAAIGTACVLAVAGCTSNPAGHLEQPLSLHDHAIAVANDLLDHAPTIAGSRRSAQPPTALLRKPPQIAGLIGLVTRSRYYTAGVPFTTAFNRLTAHPPAGLTDDGTRGRAGGPGPRDAERYAVYQSTHPPAGIADAQLLVAVSPLANGRSGVGMYAEVVPQPPRPAEELVPASIQTATVHERRNGTDRHPNTRTLSGADASGLARLFDSLRVSTLGVHGCPALFGQEMRATFATGGHSLVATYGFCSEVSVTRDGEDLPALEMKPRFFHALSRASGYRPR
jgi:hypothetical protein